MNKIRESFGNLGQGLLLFVMVTSVISAVLLGGTYIIMKSQGLG